MFSASVRLVFINNGVGDRIISGVVRTLIYDLVKIKKRSRKQSKQGHKRDGIGVRRIRTFPFSSDSADDSVVYNLVKTRLSESEAEAEE